MSSLTGAEPTRAAHPRGRSLTIAVPSVAAGTVMAGGIALALVLAAAIATGGLQVERTTDVLIGFMLAGAVLAAAALVAAPRSAAGPLHGGSALLAVALLAILTALSIVWSVMPADAWFEAVRTFGYLAVFAAGMALVRLLPRGWPAMVAGIGAGCLILSAWALLTKVFPASLAADETYARLRDPFQYWNSVGLMAAMGVPPMLWLAARRTGHAALNALAWPALVVLLTSLLLAYSRGALAALAVGLVAWFAIVPLRLRGLLALLGAAAGSALLIAWTFAQDGLTTDNAPMAARTGAGHALGALVLLVCAVLLAVGLAVQFAAAHPLAPRIRRAAGATALGGVALVPVIVLVALAASTHGIGGTISNDWHQLTNVNAQTPANTPNRLVATSSVRARYWDEALRIHAASPWLGTGAGGYATARTRYRRDDLAVRQAHGYVVQTLSDLGWAGLAASLLALFAWLWAAARVIGLRRSDRGVPWDAERVGVATLATVVLVFGVHSTIDWTWFVPANAACALLCAGWVAGRAPLRERLVGRDTEVAVPPPAADASRLERLRATAAPRAAAAALVVVIALVAAWSSYQPVRSLHASDAAYARLDAGQPGPAAAIARVAVARNPLSVDPLFDLAAIEQARGRIPAAQSALERAVKLAPGDAETWRRLGEFRLSALHDAHGALTALRAAYYLDPKDPDSVSDVLAAERAGG